MSALPTPPRPDLVFMIGAPDDMRTQRLVEAFRDRGLDVVAVVPEEVFKEDYNALKARRLLDVVAIDSKRTDDPEGIIRAIQKYAAEKAITKRQFLIFSNDDVLTQATHRVIRKLITRFQEGRRPLGDASVVTLNASYQAPQKRGHLLSITGRTGWKPGGDRAGFTKWAREFVWLRHDPVRAFRAIEKLSNGFTRKIVIKKAPGAGGIDVVCVADADTTKRVLAILPLVPGQKDVEAVEYSAEVEIPGGKNVTAMSVCSADGTKKVLAWSSKITRVVPFKYVVPVIGEDGKPVIGKNGKPERKVVEVEGATRYEEVGYTIRSGDSAPQSVLELALALPELTGLVAGASQTDMNVAFQPRFWINANGDATFIEMSPRTSGNGVAAKVELVAGIEWHEAWVAAMLGEPMPVAKKPEVQAVHVRNLTRSEYAIAKALYFGKKGVELIEPPEHRHIEYAADLLNDLVGRIIIQGSDSTVSRRERELDTAINAPAKAVGHTSDAEATVMIPMQRNGFGRELVPEQSFS